MLIGICSLVLGVYATPDLALAVRKISRDGSRRIGQVAAKIASERQDRKSL